MYMSPPQTIAPPADHKTVNPFVIVPKAAEFIDFVTDVFDGRESTAFRVPDRDGSLIHAEVVVGDSSILIAECKTGLAVHALATLGVRPRQPGSARPCRRTSRHRHHACLCLLPRIQPRSFPRSVEQPVVALRTRHSGLARAQLRSEQDRLA